MILVSYHVYILTGRLVIIELMILDLSFDYKRGESQLRQNDVKNTTPHPCYLRHFQVFDKIASFLKNFLNVFRIKKGKLHLWKTVKFTFDYFAIQFLSSSFVDYSRKQKQAKEIIYLTYKIRWKTTPQTYKLCLIIHQQLR